MIRLDEFLDVPAPGWPGRRRAIARQLLAMLAEGLVFLLILGALLGLVVVTYVATR